VQLDRVAAACAGNRKVQFVREDIVRLIERHSFTPLGGFGGEPLVNVLELNLALDERLPLSKTGISG
jgi:K+-transporting ATPase ATPase C chain